MKVEAWNNGLVLIRTFAKMNRPVCQKVYYNLCTSICQCAWAEPCPKAPAPIIAYAVDGGARHSGRPNIVRLLPNYLVPYRDQSPKTLKSSGLETKVHPKFLPTYRLSLDKG